MERSIRLIAFGVLGTLAVACTGASPTASSPAASAAPTARTATAIKFHFDWIPTSGDVPMLAAEKNGYFAAAGLTVTTTPGGPEVNCAALVGSGQQDICISPAVGIIVPAQ